MVIPCTARTQVRCKQNCIWFHLKEFLCWHHHCFHHRHARESSRGSFWSTGTPSIKENLPPTQNFLTSPFSYSGATTNSSWVDVLKIYPLLSNPPLWVAVKDTKCKRELYSFSSNFISLSFFFHGKYKKYGINKGSHPLGGSVEHWKPPSVKSFVILVVHVPWNSTAAADIITATTTEVPCHQFLGDAETKSFGSSHEETATWGCCLCRRAGQIYSRSRHVVSDGGQILEVQANPQHASTGGDGRSWTFSQAVGALQFAIPLSQQVLKLVNRRVQARGTYFFKVEDSSATNDGKIYESS